MITLISFILIMVGAGNWLCIGLMQYDFIAGFFGTQSSFMSRLIYIVVGFGAIWFLFMTIKGRGKVKINDNGFKKDPLQKEKKYQMPDEKNLPKDNSLNQMEFGRDYGEDYENNHENHNHHNPFD